MKACFGPLRPAHHASLPRCVRCELQEVLDVRWPAEPGAYELCCKIGAGASASVYRAYCQQLNAIVAVKRLDLDGRNDLACLIREATLLRRFQHQHVLLLHTSFVVGRELWMVTPFMDLGSVRNVMKRTFPQGLEEPVIATIMRSVLLGLHYVHLNNGIHRDIKADNILVNSTGEVRLADFGVASDTTCSLSIMLGRVLRSHSSTTSTAGGLVSRSSSSSSTLGCSLAAGLLALRANTFVGTPCWIAPEVILQLDEGYGTAADIWSCGITFIELATGLPPLARCHPMRVLVDTLNMPPPSLPTTDNAGRRFSRAFKDIVEQCLRKDPSKRPSAAALLRHPFFKGARDGSFLAAALQPPGEGQQAPAPASTHMPPAVLATAAVASAAPAAPAASVAAATSPARCASPGSGSTAGSGPEAPSRQVRSEPVLSRLWSLFSSSKSGLGTGAAPGFLLSSRQGSLPESRASSAHCQAGGVHNWWRVDSRRALSALVGGAAGPFRPKSSLVVPQGAAAGHGRLPGQSAACAGLEASAAVAAVAAVAATGPFATAAVVAEAVAAPATRAMGSLAREGLLPARLATAVAAF